MKRKEMARSDKGVGVKEEGKLEESGVGGKGMEEKRITENWKEKRK